MEPGAIFLLVCVLVIVVIFVAQPFTRHWYVNAQSSHEVSTLLAERERTLNDLMELDFDNGIGKIPAEEYSAQRANLIQKGSDILRHLDEIQGGQTSPAKESIQPAVVDQHKELLSDEDIEDLIAKHRAMRYQKTAGFCPNCGKPILQSDHFCSSCGQIVNSK
ncbi:MAG: zinc ribbon domain-containing protein [Anaerolineales bacterium]